MTRPPAYKRPGPPTQADITRLMGLAGWSRRGLARAVHVSEKTVDQWLAGPECSRAPTKMPPGLFELATRKINDLR